MADKLQTLVSPAGAGLRIKYNLCYRQFRRPGKAPAVKTRTQCSKQVGYQPHRIHILFSYVDFATVKTVAFYSGRQRLAKLDSAGDIARAGVKILLAAIQHLGQRRQRGKNAKDCINTMLMHRFNAVTQHAGDGDNRDAVLLASRATPTGALPPTVCESIRPSPVITSPHRAASSR